jgi:hypothetical protein
MGRYAVGMRLKLRAVFHSPKATLPGSGAPVGRGSALVEEVDAGGRVKLLLCGMLTTGWLDTYLLDKIFELDTAAHFTGGVTGACS